MSHPWSSPRLCTLRGGKGKGLLFGFMHEDPALEVALLPPGGTAACVLSAGDVAFAMARAGASRVVAADVNPAQHALARLKLALAHQRWTLSRAMHTSVREGIISDMASLWFTQESESLLRNAGVLDRPLMGAGDVDTRLRFLARWITPLVISGNGGQSKDWRWRLAWSTLGVVLPIVFPAGLRRHLPADVVTRLRRRMESALSLPEAHDNPWLQRLMQHPSALAEASFASAWPDTAAVDPQRMHLREDTLDHAMLGGSFDLIATSNIFDTEPAGALNSFLQSISVHTHTGTRIIIRSLFRDAADWPAPHSGWKVEATLTARLQSLDLSPLCRVSLVLERTS